MLEANTLILETISRKIEGDVDSLSRVDGRVEIGSGTQIINSRIRGPVVIGQNTLIENSFIGPFTSIQDHCEVRSSEVQHSILLSGSKLLNLQRRVEDSLIGMNVQIVRTEKPPQAYRFMVGDNSIIEIY